MDRQCPKNNCRSHNVIQNGKLRAGRFQQLKCKKCGYRWNILRHPEAEKTAFITKASERMVKAVAILAAEDLSFERASILIRNRFGIGKGLKPQDIKRFMVSAVAQQGWGDLTSRVLSLQPRTATPEELDAARERIEKVLQGSEDSRAEGVRRHQCFAGRKRLIAARVRCILDSRIVNLESNPQV